MATLVPIRLNAYLAGKWARLSIGGALNESGRARTEPDSWSGSRWSRGGELTSTLGMFVKLSDVSVVFADVDNTEHTDKSQRREDNSPNHNVAIKNNQKIARQTRLAEIMKKAE